MFRNRIRKSLVHLGIFGALCLWAGIEGCALLGGGGGGAPPKSKGYRVSSPNDWREEDRNESDKAYKLPSGNIVAINSSCTRNSDAPLDVLTRHLLFGSRNVEVQERQPVNIDGADGLYSKVKATVDKVPIHLHIVVLPKTGCVFDFSLVSPKPIPEKEGNEFFTFVKSFKHGSH